MKLFLTVKLLYTSAPNLLSRTEISFGNKIYFHNLENNSRVERKPVVINIISITIRIIFDEEVIFRKFMYVYFDNLGTPQLS